MTFDVPDLDIDDTQSPSIPPSKACLYGRPATTASVPSGISPSHASNTSWSTATMISRVNVSNSTTSLTTSSLMACAR